MSAETSTATSEDKASGNAARMRVPIWIYRRQQGRRKRLFYDKSSDGRRRRSDIAKIDGSYIYTVEDKYIVITDIRDGKLEEVTIFTKRLWCGGPGDGNLCGWRPTDSSCAGL